MNLKTTLALLALAAAGGLLAWYGPQLPAWLDPAWRCTTARNERSPVSTSLPCST